MDNVNRRNTSNHDPRGNLGSVGIRRKKSSRHNHVSNFFNGGLIGIFSWSRERKRRERRVQRRRWNFAIYEDGPVDRETERSGTAEKGGSKDRLGRS